MSTQSIVPHTRPAAHVPAQIVRTPRRRSRAARSTIRVETALRTSKPRALNRSVSELDEAHRRIKSNMLAIERLLRLESGLGDQESTEWILTELQSKVQAAADVQRSLCRSGHFEQVDLAVYLRRVAGALNAASGRGPDEHSSGATGWTLEFPTARLAWADEVCDLHPGSAGKRVRLDDALQFVDRDRRAVARRALCAAAVLFPPSLYRWRSPGTVWPLCGCERRTLPGDVSVGLQVADDGLAVEISVAESSLGLPQPFSVEQRSVLGLQIASLLGRLVEETTSAQCPTQVIFDVSFAPASRCGSDPS